MPIARLMVRECDVLVVLVAHRYGWVPSDQPDKGTKSITWLECEAMRAGGGGELLALVIDPKHSWPAEHEEAYRVTEALKQGTWSGAPPVIRKRLRGT